MRIQIQMWMAASDDEGQIQSYFVPTVYIGDIGLPSYWRILHFDELRPWATVRRLTETISRFDPPATKEELSVITDFVQDRYEQNCDVFYGTHYYQWLRDLYMAAGREPFSEKFLEENPEFNFNRGLSRAELESFRASVYTQFTNPSLGESHASV